jgi:ribosomal protein S18 acetylase RimI-like enzyme
MSEDTSTTLIRPAIPADVPVILALVRAHAEYEQAADEVVATEAGYHEALFGATSVACCQLAERDGVAVGMAMWFNNFSTWLGKPGIFLEDLFVSPDARDLGIGKALLLSLVDIATERGYHRVEWTVLNTNVNAQGFYRSLGALPMDDWTGWRITL